MAHDSKPAEYNPARDYVRAMDWFKWGGIIFLGLTALLYVLIG